MPHPIWRGVVVGDGTLVVPNAPTHIHATYHSLCTLDVESVWVRFERQSAWKDAAAIKLVMRANFVADVVYRRRTCPCCARICLCWIWSFWN